MIFKKNFHFFKFFFFSPTAKTSLTSLYQAMEEDKTDTESSSAVNASLPPKMPYSKNSVTILNLGAINTKDSFHDKKYIYPVGFRSEKKAWGTFYVSEICQDPQTGKVLFKVYEKTNPTERIWTDSTTSGVWKKVKEQKESSGADPKKVSISGPGFFGLADPQVRHWIEQMPGAKECKRYQRDRKSVEKSNEPKSPLKKSKLENQTSSSLSNVSEEILSEGIIEVFFF